MGYDPHLFAEKYQLAWQSAIASKPQGGLCGFEHEWNLLDSEFKPLLTVGSGPRQQSFVDYLRANCLTPWTREYSQLEVFNWMIEWATRPYYHPRGAVYEGRLVEAVLYNALHTAGRQFDDRLYAWYGNLLFQTSVGPQAIPGAWNLAKRRYLERCVELYGQALATAGTHTNLSLPESLLAWDFMHLSASERGDTHLDDYKNQFYITATRLLRAFAALFVATSASTPLRAVVRDGKPTVVLTQDDSVRNLTFPNPPTLDVPDLYRSYEDYLRISYDLVRRGVRFGNNNWTPARARSFAEPVERLILVTSDQLQDLYGRGLYAVGEAGQVEEMAHQIEIQNLLARINLPMSRVEVRTDDGGHSLEVDVANLTFKHLLLLRFYADPDFCRQFRYDREDIARARRNEELAARRGLLAEIENPLTAKPVAMRDFLSWTLGELAPLAEALGNWDDLLSLREMAEGGPNTAQRMRARLRAELGHQDEVPVDLLRELAQEREAQILHDVEMIAETCCSMTGEESKLGDFLQRARDQVRLDPQMPIRFRPRPEAMVEVTYPDKTSEILALAQQLVRIPSVTACPEERVEEVHRAATFIFDYVRNHGLQVRFYNQSKYPAVLAGLPGQMNAPVMLAGHFDVVAPDPDDSQFEPRIEGDYLWGRGAADMKTVVATYLVWLKDTLRQGPPYPPINLLLVGNEENGESEPMGTPHVLRLAGEQGRTPEGEPYAPRILIAGERTGEHGNELWGQVCTQNRGVMRLEVVAHGERGHTATSAQGELSERLVQARSTMADLFNQTLTLKGPAGWQSQVRFPFIQVGTPGVFNIAADLGVLGVEVRPIPDDGIDRALGGVEAYCAAQNLELRVLVKENGIACSPDNPYLQALIQAVGGCSGAPVTLGKKLPGTSARFAPGGQGVVWGQSGLGPHARGERHYIPSIMPYYHALQEYARVLLAHL